MNEIIALISPLYPNMLAKKAESALTWTANIPNRKTNEIIATYLLNIYWTEKSRQNFENFASYY